LLGFVFPSLQIHIVNQVLDIWTSQFHGAIKYGFTKQALAVCGVEHLIHKSSYCYLSHLISPLIDFSVFSFSVAGLLELLELEELLKE
jgi:hypothetical protein